MTRTTFNFVGALLGLVSSVAATSADLKSLEQPARKEGEVTWYTSHYPTELAEEVGRAFTRKHSGIKVNIVRTTAQVAYQRLRQDLKAGVAQADVFCTTDVGHYEALKREGKLAQYAPINNKRLFPELQKFDPDGYYYPTQADLILLIYNAQKVQPSEAPKSWKDLLDPRWKGQVASGHPAFSGFVGIWTVQMAKMFGWQYFEKLEKNKPLIGRSIVDATTMLISGERSVAAGQGQPTFLSIAKGNPLAVEYPTDGTLLLPSPCAILKNAPHPNAARLSLEFLMSKDAGEMWVNAKGQSIWPDIPQPSGVKDLRQVKVITPRSEDIISGMKDAIEHWRGIFGG